MNTSKKETESQGSESLVLKIKKLGEPGAGLYLNGQRTNDPKHLSKFQKAFKQKRVLVRRISNDDSTAA